MRSEGTVLALSVCIIVCLCVCVSVCLCVCLLPLYIAATAFVSACNEWHMRHYRRLFLDSTRGFANRERAFDVIAYYVISVACGDSAYVFCSNRDKERSDH